MRLNPDCVRDILLCVEKNTGIRKYAQFIDTFLYEQSEDFFDERIELPEYQEILLQTYSCDELIYHVRYCIESGLIEESDMSNDIRVLVPDLTPSGHEFLANIRESSNWNKTKEIGGKVGSLSISTLVKIAEGVVTALVKQHLGLL